MSGAQWANVRFDGNISTIFFLSLFSHTHTTQRKKFVHTHILPCSIKLVGNKPRLEVCVCDWLFWLYIEKAHCVTVSTISLHNRPTLLTHTLRAKKCV